LQSYGLVCATGLLLSGAALHAEVVDLTTAGSSGTIGQSFFQQIDPQSTGTGVIDPFLRVQANTSEQGYNTSASSPPFDAKAGTWTHNLKMTDLDLVTLNNQTYYRFLLDINQNQGGDSELLTLHTLQLYTGAVGSQTTTDLSQLGTLRYDMDSAVLGGAADSKIELNYLLNPGSGAGDMFAYIPTSLFLGADAMDYVYLYCEFGPNYDSNDGFEEWSIQAPRPPSPCRNRERLFLASSLWAVWAGWNAGG
jgi:hypothetical protein